MSTEVQQILESVQRLSLRERQELALAFERAKIFPAPIRATKEVIQSIKGKYAHVQTSTDEFIARKQEDLALEH
jgi:hypothetical protein